MVALVAAAPVARPVVSMFAACAYCPAATSFRCLNCGTAMCPDCVPGDLCPDCWPAPVAPVVALGGWCFADEGTDDDAVAVACAGCGDRIYTDDPSDDTYCAACSMDPADCAALRMTSETPAACAFCGAPMYGSDTDDAGTRHPRCARFLAGLDARRASWKEAPIAA